MDAQIIRLTRSRRRRWVSKTTLIRCRLRLQVKRDESTTRRGITMFELTVALFILTTVMLAIVQLMAATASQRRFVDQRRVALQEVANRAERVALLPWEQVAPGDLTTWDPSTDLQKVLPQAKCETKVTDEAALPAARRIQLSVTWTDAAGQEVEPATVTLWRFAGEKQP